MYENYDGAPTSISRPTLTKSCIYACNRTVRTPPLGENNQQKKRVYHKPQKRFKSILFSKEFERKKQPAKTKIHQSYTNASNQDFLNEIW